MEGTLKSAGHFWMNNRFIKYEDVLSLKPEQLDAAVDFEKDTICLIKKWLSDETHFSLKSSGSTGVSRIVPVTRDQLSSSAKLTIDTLDLKSSINAVLCLNPGYTAGIMFLIRALTGNFALYAVTPSSNPLEQLPDDLHVDLISLIPAQLYEILIKNQYHTHFSENTVILIGGSPVPAELEKKIERLPGRIYQTFGMAETMSHIALRRINGHDKSDSYETLGDIVVTTDPNSCLVIHAPHLSLSEVRTRDIVKLIDDRHFIWQGRLDNVVLSGGMKITIEWLESEIEKIFAMNSVHNKFFLSSLPDPKLGEKLIMLIEEPAKELTIGFVNELLERVLHKYEMPREIYFLNEFIYTRTGKIDRNRTKEIF